MLYLLIFVQLYPYPYQSFAIIIATLIVTVISIPVYCLYQSVVREMTEKKKMHFKKVLIIIGICLFVIFLEEITVSLITEHHVNKQLGFSQATPDTPEGELLEITRVDSGKIMEKSGLMLYDRVLLNSTFKLYRLLINNQGKEVTFNVLRNKQEVTIHVKVPEMELPLRKISISY